MAVLIKWPFLFDLVKFVDLLCRYVYLVVKLKLTLIILAQSFLKFISPKLV
jgi:hypothetical protein